jgi:hypothetical protein
MTLNTVTEFQQLCEVEQSAEYELSKEEITRLKDQVKCLQV